LRLHRYFSVPHLFPMAEAAACLWTLNGSFGD
jgi:hypothetical protein